MAKALITPQQAADKLAERLSGATTYIRAGIAAVTVSPMEQAAAKQDKWYQGITDAKNSGKWVNNLRAVSLDTWKNNFTTKGVDRISSGITTAKPKLVKFFSQFFPALQAARDVISAMPDNTFEDRKARAMRYMDETHKFKFNPAA